jgi:hypothetical protein
MRRMVLGARSWTKQAELSAMAATRLSGREKQVLL